MTKINRDKIEYIATLTITAIGLVSLLSYTFWHTGGLLSRFIDPGWLGYVCAFGVETIIVMMSWTLARNHNQFGWSFLSFALVAALVVSAVANFYEGFATYHAVELSHDNFVSNFDWIQFVVSVLATALISMLVFAVTDILSSGTIDTKPAQTITSPAVVKPEPVTKPKRKPAKMTIEERRRTAKAMKSEGFTLPEIAQELDVDPRTVYRDLSLNGK